MSAPHRVLIVGVGSIGERHLRCFQSTGRADLAFVEVDDGLHASIASRYAIPDALANLEQASNWKPTLAVIATPAPFHVPQATRLAEAGVHLMIEKPLSVGREGIERLRQVVRERRVVVGLAYVYRCHPLMARLRHLVQDGRFGRPVELVVVSGQHFPLYRPAYRQIYYTDRARGGGAIQDAMTHLVNAGEWLLGPISRLVVDAAHQVLEGVTVEDTVHLLCRHGQVMGSYNLNQHQAPNEMTVTIVCERGTLRAEFHDLVLRFMDTPGGTWTEERLPALERDTLFVAQANAFLDAVEGKRPVPCSLDEGIQTLEVNLAALASMEGGVWQSISTSRDPS